MKLIKTIIFLAVFVLVLNYFGLLSPDFSEKVDSAVDTTITKVNEIEYKGKKLTDMTLKEIATNVKTDVEYIKEEVVTEDGIVLTGENLRISLTLNKDIILDAQLDTSDSEAVASVEKVINDFTGKDYKIPEEMLEKGNVNIYVEKAEDGYEVKFK